MPAEMESYAKEAAVEALKNATRAAEVAGYVRTSFTQKYGGGWGCIAYEARENCTVGADFHILNGGNCTHFELKEWDFVIVGY